MVEFITFEQVADLLRNGDGVVSSGFAGITHPDAISAAIEKRFLETGSPKNLSLFYCAGQGTHDGKGLDRFGHEGLLKFVIGGHFGFHPKIVKLILDDKIEAYAYPQGIISHLIRAASGGKPGVITHIGLGTFVDPRKDCAALNSISKRKFIELVKIDGKEYLFYKSEPFKKANFAIIRGTTADENGNITMEKEAATLEALSMATLVKNNGGIVVIQVERIAKKETFHPQMVKIPGHLVDYVLKTPSEDYHWQTFQEKYNPAYSGEIKVPPSEFPKLPLNERKIIGRRAALELKLGNIVNIGIGMPEAVSLVAGEEGIFENIILTVEDGVVGGVPAGGLSFGASVNPWAIIDQPYMFDFYDGGGIEIAFLGMAEVDEEGNVNVSKFGSRLPGPGGFINISQSAKKVVFCGTLTVGAEFKIVGGEMKIVKGGKAKKFVKEVEHVTFSGEYARKFNQEILYVTERAVFNLSKEGLELIEYAPGIDIEKDVISQMEFEPIITEPKEMDRRIFDNKIMGLKNLLPTKQKVR